MQLTDQGSVSQDPPYYKFHNSSTPFSFPVSALKKNLHNFKLKKLILPEKERKSTTQNNQISQSQHY